MSQIKNPPNEYDFGYAFNYAMWRADTDLTLCNVNWDQSYRDVIYFEGGQTGLDAHIDSKGNANTNISNASVAKVNQPVKINLEYDDALKFNYIRATNGDKSYYYFIVGVTYVAPNTTMLTVQLDVFQTFVYGVVFGYSYLERGHAAISDNNSFAQYGRAALTQPEGLDVGGEYRTVHVETKNIMTNDDSTNTNPDVGYDILVCSTIDLTADPGTVDNPTLKTAKGSSIQGMPSGAAFYVFKTSYDFRTFMLGYSNKPWVTQGIISVTAIPNLKRVYGSSYNYGDNVSPLSGVAMYNAPTGGPNNAAVPKYTMYGDWRNKQVFKNILGNRYRNLKKFFTYPYMVIEMTTFTGTPLILKPEMWQDPDATIREMIAIVPPGQRVVLMPNRYNADAETLNGDTQGAEGSGSDDYGEHLDMATVISGFPTFPVVNNMAIGYLASNKNSLAFQFKNADWSQQRAMAGAQNAYDVATQQSNLVGQLSGISQAGLYAGSALAQNQAIARGLLQATTGGIQGAVGGSLGGPAGAVAGGALGAGSAVVGMGIESDRITQQTAIDGTQMQRTSGAQQGAQNRIRDTNYDLAQFSAKGDYANATAGINARIQDAALTQPSVSGQFGGDAFNLITDNVAVSLRWKMLNLSALRAIGDMWLRYGYTVNRYMRPPVNFKVMSKFSYWKFQESYLVQGALPENYKDTIRGIFEKGVTVWSNPSDVGNIDISTNEPIAGTYF